MPEMVGVIGAADSTVVGAFVALLGAVVGGVLTLLVERYRQKHENRARFHMRRLGAYEEFVAQVLELSIEHIQRRPGDPFVSMAAVLAVRRHERALTLLGTAGMQRAVASVMHHLELLLEVDDVPVGREVAKKFGKDLGDSLHKLALETSKALEIPLESPNSLLISEEGDVREPPSTPA